MKKTLALLTLISVALTGCCPNSQYRDVVKETYIHKYGVPMAKSDWDEQGKDGQIIALHKDGVTVITSYAQGGIHGPTSYSFPNSSTIQRVETFSYGELVSKKENYPSGIPMKEELFEEDSVVKVTQWYEDGTPQGNEIYQDTFLISGEYRTPLNVIESRVADGHGTRIFRTNEGDLLSKDRIQNGQMVERLCYYTNGDPSTVTPYENGVVHGTRLTFLPGGLPDSIEQWVHGIQEGTTVVYQNGEKISEVPYVRGKKNGIEYRYRDGILLVEEVSWKDNQQHGPRKLYVDGSTKTEWYHAGEMVSRTAYERMNMPRRATT
jgi:antitoxin component YwqK of YwqJK toxin-antitoxin module